MGKMMTSVEYINRRLSKIHLMNCGACTGCFGRIGTALRRVDDSRIKENVYVAIGPDIDTADLKGKVLLCGNCAAPTFYNKRRGAFIPGCPPDLKRILEEIKKIGGIIGRY
jgi:Ni,Fe-hydrogenase III small subunit